MWPWQGADDFGDDFVAMRDSAWRKLLRSGARPAALCAALGWNSSARAGRPSIIDAFLYNGEATLLALRRLELRGVVSRHAYTISALSFSGVRRDDELDDLRRPAAAADAGVAEVQVLTVSLEEQQTTCGKLRTHKDRNYCREALLRNSLARAADGLAEHDWVLLSDVDEVPDATTLRLLRSCSVPHDVLVFRSHRHYIYSTACVVTGGAKQYWTSRNAQLAVGPVAVRVSAMRLHGLQAARKTRYDCHAVGPHASCTPPAREVLPPSAWHLSSCMPSRAVVHKLGTFSDPIRTRFARKGKAADLGTVAAVAAVGVAHRGGGGGGDGTNRSTEALRREGVAAVDQLRASCTDPKGYYEMTRMPAPLSTYPDVPRAVEADSRRFAELMLL